MVSSINNNPAVYSRSCLRSRWARLACLSRRVFVSDIVRHSALSSRPRYDGGILRLWAGRTSLFFPPMFRRQDLRYSKTLFAAWLSNNGALLLYVRSAPPPPRMNVWSDLSLSRRLLLPLCGPSSCCFAVTLHRAISGVDVTDGLSLLVRCMTVVCVHLVTFGSYQAQIKKKINSQASSCEAFTARL